MTKNYSICRLLGTGVVVWLMSWGMLPHYSAYAQTTTGTILGTVTDDSGAVVPGVAIRVENLDTGLTRTLVTSDLGTYRSTNLPLGTYALTAELPGFNRVTRSGIELTLGRQAVVNFALPLGDVTEMITVSGEAALVSTTSSTLSELVDQKQIRDLPLNGRDFLQLSTLQPGVIITRAQRDSISPQTGTGLNISIGGGRPTQNNFRVDGISVNDHANSSPGSSTGNNLGVEAIREFSVLTNTYSAEYGRSSGGVINAVTRTGTNQYHGSLLYFHRNDNLDARNFFDPGDLPEFRRHQFGVTAGGPIVQDKTFFFVNYEGLREQLAQTAISNVLTAEARAGNLSGGSVVVDDQVKPYINLYPLPNGEIVGDTGRFFSAPARDTEEDYFLVRADHIFSESLTLKGSYTFNDANVTEPERLLVLEFLSPSRRQYVTAELTQIISPSLVNSFRFGYARSLTSTGETVPLIDAATDPSLGFLPGRPVGQIRISGVTSYPGGAGAPDTEFYIFESYQFYDNVVYDMGRHSLKFGFNFEIIRDAMRSSNSENARWRFRSIKQFLTNEPSQFRSQLPGSDTDRFISQSVWGFYIQDDFRWKPNFTWNLGLRYEFSTQPTERDGEMSTFRNLTDPEATVGLFFENPAPVNFAPRIGFAWDPSGEGKSAIRAGFGIFYDLILPFYLTDPGLRGLPFFFRSETPRGLFSQGDFPDNGLEVLLQNTQLSTDFIEINPSTGYRMQYNLNLQHEIFQNTVVTVGYVGGRGVHLSRVSGDENTATGVTRADGRLFFAEGLPKANPIIGRMRVWHFDSNSFYNGILLGVNRRWSENLMIQGSYTMSKSVDDGSSTFTTNHYRNTIHTAYPPRRDLGRGLSDFDMRQNLVINATWNIPSRVAGPAGTILNGWQLGGIFTAHSGIPFTVQIDGDRARTQGIRTGQGPDLAPGASTNPRIGKVDQWFDTSAFVFPEEGVLGNLGRGTLIGPGLTALDFSFIKNTRIPSISETFNIVFRFELFNIFNRANFNIPTGDERTIFNDDGELTDEAGRISSTVTTNREIQFGMKISW